MGRGGKGINRAHPIDLVGLGVWPGMPRPEIFETEINAITCILSNISSGSRGGYNPPLQAQLLTNVAGDSPADRNTWKQQWFNVMFQHWKHVESSLGFESGADGEITVLLIETAII